MWSRGRCVAVTMPTARAGGFSFLLFTRGEARFCAGHVSGAINARRRGMSWRGIGRVGSHVCDPLSLLILQEKRARCFTVHMDYEYIRYMSVLETLVWYNFVKGNTMYDIMALFGCLA